MELGKGAAIVGVIAISCIWLLPGSEDGIFSIGKYWTKMFFRFFDSELEAPAVTMRFYYYVPTLIAGMFPWSLFFPLVGYFLYRSRLQEKKLLYLVCLVF